MADFIGTFVLLWATYGTLVFFVVVIALGFILPTKIDGPRGWKLAVVRVVGALFGMAVILSIMMVVSQWVLSLYFVDALSVGEMMREMFVQGLAIYLLLGLPFIFIRTFQLHLKARKRMAA